MENKKFNVCALLGLIFSVIGAILTVIYSLSGTAYIGNANALIYIFLPCNIAGVVLGIAGAVQAKKCRSGLAMSIIAIVVGALATFAFAGFFILLLIVFATVGKA